MVRTLFEINIPIQSPQTPLQAMLSSPNGVAVSQAHAGRKSRAGGIRTSPTLDYHSLIANKESACSEAGVSIVTRQIGYVNVIDLPLNQPLFHAGLGFPSRDRYRHRGTAD